MHFKGRNSVNREGIFFGISPNREDIAAAIEKSNVIVRKGAYEHVALTVTQVKLHFVFVNEKLNQEYVKRS